MGKRKDQRFVASELDARWVATQDKKIKLRRLTAKINLMRYITVSTSKSDISLPKRDALFVVRLE